MNEYVRKFLYYNFIIYWFNFLKIGKTHKSLSKPPWAFIYKRYSNIAKYSQSVGPQSFYKFFIVGRSKFHINMEKYTNG